jgi:hypothetical protein
MSFDKLHGVEGGAATHFNEAIFSYLSNQMTDSEALTIIDDRQVVQTPSPLLPVILSFQVQRATSLAEFPHYCESNNNNLR